MKNQSPLKRVEELKAFSKDHHHGLLLGWKIRAGLDKGVSVERISMYLRWFYENYLLPHFELEENYIFPVLGNAHTLIERGIMEHREIQIILKHPLNKHELIKLADLLKSHIRFEERILFQEIQSVATKEQLLKILQVHNDTPFTEHSDEFWKS